MSSRQRLSDSDEITPIRQADGTASSRNYNTAEIDTPGSPEDDPTPTATTDGSKNPNTAIGEDTEEKLPWYKRVAEKYGSISLENKGSTARDHLALERTFLAWLRTSLAFASIGIAITQLFRLNTSIASRSSTQHIVPAGIDRRSAELSFSPLLGHSIPAEAVQHFTGQADEQSQPQIPSELGPTLLDQLLLLPPAGSSHNGLASTDRGYAPQAFNEDAAARLRQVGKPLGATFLAIAILVLLVGFHRYFEAQHWIVRGKFPASRGSVALVGFVAFALIVASLVVVLVVAPSSFES